MRLRVALLALLVASKAWADPFPPIGAFPPGDDKIAVVQAGQAAPFSGQLFDPSTALRWANWLQQYKARLELDVDTERQKCLAITAYDQKVLDAEQKRADVIQKDLEARLIRSEKARLVAEEEARNPAWYKTTTFGIAVGAVGTAVITALSIWAIETTSKHD